MVDEGVIELVVVVVEMAIGGTVDAATAEEDDTNSLYTEAVWKKI